jgi:hypothetical protein
VGGDPDLLQNITQLISEMALIIVEVTVARVASIHCNLHIDLHGVQVHPYHGAAGPAGEIDQVVQAPVNRFA